MKQANTKRNFFSNKTEYVGIHNNERIKVYQKYFDFRTYCHQITIAVNQPKHVNSIAAQNQRIKKSISR